MWSNFTQSAHVSHNGSSTSDGVFTQTTPETLVTLIHVIIPLQLPLRWLQSSSDFTQVTPETGDNRHLMWPAGDRVWDNIILERNISYGILILLPSHPL